MTSSSCHISLVRGLLAVLRAGKVRVLGTFKQLIACSACWLLDEAKIQFLGVMCIKTHLI